LQLQYNILNQKHTSLSSSHEEKLKQLTADYNLEISKMSEELRISKSDTQKYQLLHSDESRKHNVTKNSLVTYQEAWKKLKEENKGIIEQVGQAAREAEKVKKEMANVQKLNETYTQMIAEYRTKVNIIKGMDFVCLMIAT
jgi:phage host-nuclease inhibitor protein Gam